MNLLKIAHVPPLTVAPSDMVQRAIDLTVPKKIGAVAVVDGDTLVGVFTARDLIHKVVHPGLSPATTRIADVMTSPAITVPADTPCRDVLRIMLDKHIRHVPISEDGRTVAGILSLRNALQHMVEDLQEDLQSMAAFLNTDGIGG